jgi:dienelactone hydrolase
MDEEASVSPLQFYRGLSDSVFAHYEAGQQREALALLDGTGPELTPWHAEIAHLRACLHGSLDEPEAALAALTGAHAAGGWWDPAVLVEDDDLSSLSAMPEFGALVESSRRRWEHANAEPDRSGDRIARPSGPARGVLVALHGAEEDADDAIAAWRPAAELGLALLAVRSSRRTSPSYRSWPDQERAGAEIAGALATLPADLRDLPVIAAGFSAGGRVALLWALSATPSAVAGVVAVAPAVRGEPTRTSGQILEPALIIVGEDDDLVDDVVGAGRTLSGAGFTTDVVAGLGHRFPDDFPRRLATALDSWRRQG